MTVQIVEIAGQKMAMLPVADYERLVDNAGSGKQWRSLADALHVGIDDLLPGA